MIGSFAVIVLTIFHVKLAGAPHFVGEVVSLNPSCH